MNDSSAQPRDRMGARSWIASVWPVLLATDSELQRRKKLAVRGGHVAVVTMVVAAIAGAITADFGRMPAVHIALMVVAGMSFIGWSLYGTRHAVRLLLWERGTAPPPWWSQGSRWKVVIYFAVQLALAGLIFALGGSGRSSNLLWLVLLPPVAHSVILLPRLGVALVSILSMAILVLDLVRWGGWASVPNAWLAFSFAVLFTLVFTQLAVSSERARGDVQRLAGELGDANRQLRAYAVQAEELAATRERNRLAREIHDSLGHYLTVVNVQIEAARALQCRDPERTRDALEKAQTLTQEGLREIRRSVAALRASPLDDRPLVHELRQMVEECRTSGLAATMQLLGETRLLSPQAALTVYRAVQEGLTNVRKHARATGVWIEIDFRVATQVRLSIRDDGAGAADGNSATSGFGLLGLRERAQLLGGEVRVQTAPGAGFQLEVEVPG